MICQYSKLTLFSGFYSKEDFSRHTNRSKGFESVSMDGNIIPSMSRAFSNIPTTQYFFKRTLKTSYLLPAQGYLASKRYNNSVFDRIFPGMYNWMGFNFSNTFDWVQLFLAISVSPIFILISFFIVILYLYL